MLCTPTEKLTNILDFIAEMKVRLSNKETDVNDNEEVTMRKASGVAAAFCPKW